MQNDIFQEKHGAVVLDLNLLFDSCACQNLSFCLIILKKKIKKTAGAL